MRIDVRGVSKRIGPNQVLDDVDASFQSGTIMGLVGANGSGKTMLVRAVCGLMRIDAGRIAVDGREVAFGQVPPCRIGALIENPAFVEGRRGLANLDLLAGITGAADRDDQVRAMERAGLDPGLKTKVKGYSLGMRQRLGIAMAVMERPDLLVLDEPTNALDAEGLQMLRRVVREERDRGACVIVTSHDRRFVRDVCDRAYEMQAGRVTGEVAA